MSESARMGRLLTGGGEMGKVVRAKDWSRTPLGPIESWPQSLLTTVSLCLASNFPISIAWGPQRTQIYNDGYWPICGAKHPQAMGQDFRECWFSAWPVIGDAFDAASAGQTRFLTNQRMFLDRNGYLEETFFTFSFSPISDESGGVGGLFHPVTELTQQSLTERRLKVLRALADQTADTKSVAEACVQIAAVLTRADLDVPFALLYLVGPSAARIAAYSGIDPRSPLAAPSIPLDAEVASGWTLGRVVTAGQPHTVTDLRQRFPSTHCGPYPEAPHTAVVSPIFVPGLAAPFAVLITGVSARRALDEPYETFCAMLADGVTNALIGARSYAEERERAELLAELDRAKTAFFSNVSHEFRTPLTLMLGPLEEILSGRDEPVGPRTSERLDMAHRNSVRLLKLVNTLLDFSRIEAGRMQATYEATDIGALTAELASVFRSAIERAGLTLDVSIEPVANPVYVDRDMWEKVILNLLSNAFKFTLNGGITVAVRDHGAQVVIAVRDTGTGIPADELPHIFERFHRVKGAQGRTHEGSGIGLALVHELVKLHGGSIVVQSEPAKGTTFTVTLPTGRAHLPQDRVNAEATLVPTALGAAPFVQEALSWLPNGNGGEVLATESVERMHVTTANAHVLVADDNPDMREYLRRILAPYWKVDVVADGEAALEAVRRGGVELILTDVMMPKRDGFSLLQAIREDARTRTLPVILLSARAGDEARVEGLDAGADDYLIKPFSAREIVARVNAHLETARIRRAAVEQLRESEEQLRVVSNSVPALIALVGADLRYRFCNHSYTEWFGLPREAIVGSTMQDVLGEEAWQAIAPHVHAALAGTRAEFETEARYARGGTRWIHAVYTPHRDASGAIVGFVVLVSDITTRKQIEHALREADRQKDEFLAMLAHELRNPLAPIRNATEVLRALASEEPKTQIARDIIARQVAHMTRLVDDLLDVSRITQGKITLQPQRLSLTSIVEAAIESVRPQIEREEHTLTVELAGGLYVAGDRARLVQIMTNLLANAAKFTPDGGHIFLRSFVDGPDVVLTVRDTGVGIAPEAQERIFNLFQQEDATLERSQGGLGIGLTLAKRLLEMHGGSIGVSSAGVGQGTEFTVRLPVAAAAQPETVASGSRTATTGTRALQIVLVEDSKDTAESFKLLLELHGHRVAVASNGPDGIRAIERLAPDVAFIDIGLPGLDGFGVARHVRARSTTHPALVALSGYGRAEDRERAKAAGFDEHMTKPVDYERVARFLSSLEGAGSRAGSATYDR